jgi:hypothetical protein
MLEKAASNCALVGGMVSSYSLLTTKAGIYVLPTL